MEVWFAAQDGADWTGAVELVLVLVLKLERVLELDWSCRELGLELGWTGLGWAELGWAGLGWAGLGLAGLGRAAHTQIFLINHR